jgi:hypothetical protein
VEIFEQFMDHGEAEGHVDGVCDVADVHGSAPANRHEDGLSCKSRLYC